ncbi:MAG: reverse transcriptase domain-containing protein [Opitutaceae bacterium]
MDKIAKCVHGVITPPCGVLSPLLANLYLNSPDHGVNDHPELDAKLIRYADDFVLLCRPGDGGAMLERLKKYVHAKRLTLNETKTRLVNFQQESFRFLGFDFAWRRSPRTGQCFVHVEPSPKARLNLRDAIREELNHWTKHRSCAEAVRRVNRITRGWSNYYHHGPRSKALARADFHLLHFRARGDRGVVRDSHRARSIRRKAGSGRPAVRSLAACADARVARSHGAGVSRRGVVSHRDPGAGAVASRSRRRRSRSWS